MQNYIHPKMKPIFVISGSSGVGKGTIIEGFLRRNPDFKLSISCTTRSKREGEIDGVNYFFLSKEEFKKSIENDEFLEWAEFSENFYGTKRAFVEKCKSENCHLILELDTQGAFQVKEKINEAVLIFIAPPSYEDLVSRLKNRNTESDDVIAKRLDFVKFEIENSKKFDHIIINDTVENAVLKMEEIINSERADYA